MRANGGRRQAPAQCEAGGAAERLHLLHYRRVVGRLHHHGHVLVVLGCRPDHGRAADVDGLDALIERSTVPHRFFKGIEVDRHQVDAGDAVRLQRRTMAGIVPAGENAAVDRRMQGLDPSVHDLGKAGVVRDIGDRDTGLTQDARRAAGGQDGDAKARKRGRECFESGLVGDRDERVGDGPAWRVGH